MTTRFEKQITKAEIALTGVACVFLTSLFAMVVVAKAF
jgi:hypothetical protein